MAEQDPMLVGADTPPVEVSPNPDPQVSLPVHQIMLVVNGIHLLENLKLDDLAAKRVHEFAFMLQPLKLQGFTGSSVRRSRFADADGGAARAAPTARGAY